tara:strand:+ start:257 stop:583 length:327 start_codon:yes stop_codon:yes gene_type:complete
VTDQEKKELVDKLYEKLIMTANRFLFHAKNFHMSVLKLENPTYAEVAGEFRRVAGIIDILAEQIDDALIGGKADEYVTYMEQIAQAIDKECAETLESIVNELDKRSFL